MPMGVTGLSELRLPAGRHAFPLSGNAFNPKRERQQAGILLNRRRARHLCPLAQQKGVPHDLRLLLDAVALERPAGLQGVAVAAEGMAGQRQPDAALMLPVMGHLMDEKALRLQRAAAKILRSEDPTSELQSPMRTSHA